MITPRGDDIPDPPTDPEERREWKRRYYASLYGMSSNQLKSVFQQQRRPDKRRLMLDCTASGLMADKSILLISPDLESAAAFVADLISAYPTLQHLANLSYSVVGEEYMAVAEREKDTLTILEDDMFLGRGLDDEDKRIGEPTLDQVDEGPLDDDDLDEDEDDLDEDDDDDDEDFFEDDDEDDEDEPDEMDLDMEHPQ